MPHANMSSAPKDPNLREKRTGSRSHGATPEWDKGRAARVEVIDTESSRGLWRKMIRKCVCFQILYWNLKYKWGH